MDNDSMSGMKTMQDVHTKEIDLVNRDPKYLNDDVVKVSSNPNQSVYWMWYYYACYHCNIPMTTGNCHLHDD